MTSDRTATIKRETSESSIELSINLDGTGASSIETSVPFYDHMLTAFSKHSLIDLTVKASGDTHIDVHHTVEDIGIALGLAIKQALGTKAGISRYGDALVPLDEALVRAVVDVSARISYTRGSLLVSRCTSSVVTSRVQWFVTCLRRLATTRASQFT